MVKIYRFFFAASVLAAFAACSSKSDLLTEEIADTPEVWTVSIDATKAPTKALTESGNTITASWVAGDVVYICNSSYDYGTMTAESSGTTTRLVGTVTKTMKVGNKYTLRYLQRGQNSLWLPAQKGTLEDIAKNHDIAEASVTVKSIDGNNVTFEETVANFESKISITKFTVNVPIKNANIFCTNLKTYVRPGYSGVYSHIEIAPAEETSTVYVAMSTLNDEKSIFSFLVKGADDKYYVGKKKAQLQNGKNYATSVTLEEMPAYVDLGIRRDGYAICWATVNVGATHPGEIGNYYAWGETSPKSSYTWDNYPYGSYSWITKYDPDRPDQGVVDGLATLLPEDDAATANLGSGWRTPHKNDYTDMLNSSNIDMKNVYADGTWGYIFISKIAGFEGRFVFLPRTFGYYKEDAQQEKSYSYYWTNNIDQQSWTSSSFANTFYFSNPNTNYPTTPTTSRMDRAYGLAVRAVYPISTGAL